MTPSDLNAIIDDAGNTTLGPWWYSEDNQNVYVGPADADYCIAAIYQSNDPTDKTGQHIANCDPQTVAALARIALAAAAHVTADDDGYGASMIGLENALRDAGLIK